LSAMAKQDGPPHFLEKSSFHLTQMDQTSPFRSV
jgi:hypothetical protein